MNAHNPISVAEIAIPTIKDCHHLASTLKGLLAAMNAQVDLIGPKGGGLFVCIDLAQPIADQLVDALDLHFS